MLDGARHRHRPRPRTAHRPAQIRGTLRGRSGTGTLELLEKSILLQQRRDAPIRARTEKPPLPPPPAPAGKIMDSLPPARVIAPARPPHRHPPQRSPSRVPFRPLFYMIVRYITLRSSYLSPSIWTCENGSAARILIRTFPRWELAQSPAVAATLTRDAACGARSTPSSAGRSARCSKLRAE